MNQAVFRSLASRAVAVLLLSSACGGRTLNASSTSDHPDSGLVAESGADRATPGDASGPDLCPSALLASAPRAMLASCSTRDGRSRVTGPTNPHVTWTTPVIMDRSGRSSFMGLAADASGAAYLVVGDEDDDFGSFVRIDAAGGIDWTTPFTPLSSGYTAPLLLANGAVEFLGALASGPGAGLDRFDVATGLETTTSLAAALAGASGDPAVGSDGSLYVAYENTASTAPSSGQVVSRLAPDGTASWTSVAFRTLVPPGPIALSEVAPVTVALGVGDLVLVTAQVVPEFDSPPMGLLMAFDPASGKTRWAKELAGTLVGLAVAKDGSIAVLALSDEGTAAGMAPSSLLVFDATGSQVLDVRTGSAAATALFAIAVDGAMLLGTQTGLGAGFDGLMAIDAAGKPTWSLPTQGLQTVTLDASGTVLAVTSDALEGLDPSMGHLLWTVAAPHAGATILDATFTGSGAIIAEMSDGTVFGAMD